MSIHDQAKRIPLDQINIDRAGRQRRELKTDDLERSIKARGLIHPLVVELRPDGKIWLVTGERRLTAVRNLGELDVLVRFTSELDSSERQILELEENIKRQDLSWQENCQAIVRIHTLYSAADPDWTGEKTAQQIGLNPGYISMFLSVWRNWTNDRVREAGTIREAYNVIQRKEKRESGDQLQELIEVTRNIELPPQLPQPQVLAPQAPQAPQTSGPEHSTWAGSPLESLQFLSPEYQPAEAIPSLPPPPVIPTIQNLSFLDWLPDYSGQKFSLVHCDFPYGVNLFDGAQGRGGEEGAGAMYKDSEDVYWTLLENFLLHRNQFMSISSHLMFWYSAKHYDRTLQMFKDLAPEIQFRRHPLIWVKSDNMGIIADPRRDPRHVYETCLLASRGDRFVLRSVGDAYSGPTDKKLHPSAKPEPMLRHFMSMLVDENSSVFDPTCGSGASLRAGDSLGAQRLLGLELDADYARVAEKEFQNSRLKREAAAAAKASGLGL